MADTDIKILLAIIEMQEQSIAAIYKGWCECSEIWHTKPPSKPPDMPENAREIVEKLKKGKL